MAFKGFNSILFEFDSIVDTKVSTILFLKSICTKNTIKGFDNERIISYSNDIKDLLFDRIYGFKDIFSFIILDEEMEKDSENIFKSLFTNNEEEILNKYAYFTNIKELISAYRKAGEGTIKTAIHCNNDTERKFILKYFPDTTIEFGDRKDIDMGKYGRIVSGNYKDIFEYKFEEPKNILITDFRENFSDDDITALHPEFIVEFGDINSIEVITAYNTEDLIDQESKG